MPDLRHIYIQKSIISRKSNATSAHRYKQNTFFVTHKTGRLFCLNQLIQASVATKHPSLQVNMARRARPSITHVLQLRCQTSLDLIATWCLFFLNSALFWSLKGTINQATLVIRSPTIYTQYGVFLYYHPSSAVLSGSTSKLATESVAI